jgi:hypothetical protein
MSGMYVSMYVNTIQEFYMKEITSMSFPQHGEVLMVRLYFDAYTKANNGGFGCHILRIILIDAFCKGD